MGGKKQRPMVDRSKFRFIRQSNGIAFGTDPRCTDPTLGA